MQSGPRVGRAGRGGVGYAQSAVAGVGWYWEILTPCGRGPICLAAGCPTDSQQALAVAVLVGSVPQVMVMMTCQITSVNVAVHWCCPPVHGYPVMPMGVVTTRSPVPIAQR